MPFFLRPFQFSSAGLYLYSFTSIGVTTLPAFIIYLSYISKHPICGSLREKAVFRFPVLDERFGLFAAPTATEPRHHAALDIFSMNCPACSPSDDIIFSQA